MESIVENVSSLDPLAITPSDVTPANIVQLIPSHTSNIQAQSVIQPNQLSVIQQSHPVTLAKSTVLLVSKPNTVIHSAQTGIQSVQIKAEPNITGNNNMMNDTNSESSYTDDEAPKKRRDLLTRRPSYRKILNDLGGGEIVLATPGSIQLANSQSGDSSTSSVLQYSQNQDGNMFVPVSIGSGNGVGEDQTRKREIRLLKNREAARECRRKKKEYIKCLENRVAVLENQNKALIEELKSLKELYCQQKSD